MHTMTKIETTCIKGYLVFGDMLLPYKIFSSSTTRWAESSSPNYRILIRGVPRQPPIVLHNLKTNPLCAFSCLRYPSLSGSSSKKASYSLFHCFFCIAYSSLYCWTDNKSIRNKSLFSLIHLTSLSFSFMLVHIDPNWRRISLSDISGSLWRTSDIFSLRNKTYALLCWMEMRNNIYTSYSYRQ